MRPPSDATTAAVPETGVRTVLDGAAVALLDEDGTIMWWSQEASKLLGRSGVEAVGMRARDLLARRGQRKPPGDEPAAVARAIASGMRPVTLRHRSGRPVPVLLRLLRADGAPGTVALAMPAETAAAWTEDAAMASAMLNQDRIAVVLYDNSLDVMRANAAYDAVRPAGAPDRWLQDLPGITRAGPAGQRLREVLMTGVPLLAVEYRLGSADDDSAVALSAFRMENPRGTPVGVAVAAAEITERRRAQRRLSTAYEAAVGMGGSLDVVRCAHELAEVLVPALGDVVTVDLSDSVMAGSEPASSADPAAITMRRVAVKHVGGKWPPELVQIGETLPEIPDRPESTVTGEGEWPITGTVQRSEAWTDDDRELIRRMVPEGMRASISAPLSHRGLVLGYVNVTRTENPAPFDEQDVKLLEEVVSRAALTIDNARRYAREHQTAVVLQHSLLPPSSTDSAAATTAGTYLPAGGTASVGGDWFDAIPLSSLRIALVVGDVIGHGLQATATMARLRTAIQTLADLDLSPDELLIRLDDLVQRMRAEAEQPDAVGATCLIALYDPVTRWCQVASAGHPPPAVVLPDGTADFLDVSPGPPLGVGDMPFEVTSLHLPGDSLLALYSDGLINARCDPASGMRNLRRDLAAAWRSGRSLEQIGEHVIARAPAAPPPTDDITLLLARTRAVRPENIAVWEFPADPAAVQEARSAATRQLRAWGLYDLLFTTELVVSELVTNAIRYAGGPVTLRLVRDRVLLCEVSDPSNTQPRLRRARGTDEGGRGLFLVAQLTARWGSRYGALGKTIWTEQSLGGPGGVPDR